MAPRLDALDAPAGMRLSALSTTPAVAGTLALPLLVVQMPDRMLGSITPAAIAERTVGAPDGLLSAAEYYEQASGGRLTITGEHTAYPINLPNTSSWYVGDRGTNQVAARLDVFLRDVASRAYDRFDWARFDNDGPDGVPNSGDDDGIADVVVILYSTEDGSCTSANNGRMWAHRWNLSAALGEPWPTGSTGEDGTPILIDDYIAVPILDCDSETLAPNGTLIHELGHVLNLPDLYPTDGSDHHGVGLWDLMGSGNWYSQENPTALGAWSRVLLGWAEEVETRDAVDLEITSIHSGGVVHHVPSPDSDDFLLIELRTRTSGIDAGLPEEGLVIWQVDPSAVAERAALNTINNDPDHPGIVVRQADGANHLGKGTNRGDTGDPWPGASLATSLTHQSQPAAVTLGDGAPLGVRLDAIRWHEGAIRLDVTTGLVLTTTVRIESAVDGVPATLNDTIPVTLPWEGAFPTGSTLTIAVDTSDVAGTRVRVDGWTDGAEGADRSIALDSRTPVALTLEATRQHRVAVQAGDAALGDVRVTDAAGADLSDAWVDAGRPISIRAEATDADRFLYWDADLGYHSDAAAWAREPAALTHVVDAAIVLRAVFSDLPADGVGLDRALTAPGSVPAALADWLDATGNRNGALDSGDFVLALRDGRLLSSETGLHLPLPTP